MRGKGKRRGQGPQGSNGMAFELYSELHGRFEAEEAVLRREHKGEGYKERSRVATVAIILARGGDG